MSPEVLTKAVSEGNWPLALVAVLGITLWVAKEIAIIISKKKNGQPSNTPPCERCGVVMGNVVDVQRKVVALIDQMDTKNSYEHRDIQASVSRVEAKLDKAI